MATSGNIRDRLKMETSRLHLRPFEISDAAELYALNADPEVIRYTCDPPFASKDEAAALVSGYDQYDTHGMGRLSVLLKQTGAWLGWCGLKYHPENEMVELGFRFHRRYWGNGYATESARACLSYGFGTGLQTIAARTVAANKASIRVLERLGMKPAGTGNFHGMDGRVFRLSREDFLSRQK